MQALFVELFYASYSILYTKLNLSSLQSQFNGSSGSTQYGFIEIIALMTLRTPGTSRMRIYMLMIPCREVI